MSVSILAIGMMLASLQPATQLSIQPWTGTELSTTSAAAAKYRLTVTGTPDSAVHLQASGVADGWLAAFCTPKICSPQRVDVAIPSSGETVLQFELIRESDTAPTRSGATISDDGGASVSVPAVHRG
jgi:hypothetical protein